MLKHVQVSPYSSCRSRASRSRADTVSLSSSASFGSEALSSLSSSTSSLQEPVKILKPHTVAVKIYASVLRSDIEYVTLSISPRASSKDVITMALNKYRMKHRDPNLFFLVMEIGIRKTGLPMRTIMVLEDESRPAELQACHPMGNSKFSLQLRRGGLVKIYDSCLMAESKYKSLLISERTTVDELIQLLLNCYNVKDRTSKYSIYELCKNKKYERKLYPDERPLLMQQQWPNPENFAFQIKKNPETMLQRKKLPWTTSMDLSGNVNFRLSLRDEVNPKILHSPTLKPSYNDYENYFYI